MITYEKFKDIIVKYIRFRKVDHQLYKMGIDIDEGPLSETTGYYFDWLWEAYFNEDGCDTISWWVFEYHDIDEDFDNDGNYIGEKMEPGMWDKDDNIIPMITIEDLWNEVQDQRKEYVDTPKEALTKTITDMISLHIQNAAEPVNLDVLEGAVGETWEELKAYFEDVDKLVCVDNTDEATADILATYLEGKIPYKTYECEYCDADIFLDSKVGTLMVLHADDFELYVWQG